jgi:hypothetical protein
MASSIHPNIITTTTTPIPVTLTYVSTTRLTVSVISPTAPLLIGTLTLTNRPPAAGGVIGNVNPGVATVLNPATHTLSMGTEFATILNFVLSWYGSLAVEITYDPNTWLAYDCVPVGIGGQLLASEAAVRSVDGHASAISEGVTALNLGLQALLEETRRHSPRASKDLRQPRGNNKTVGAAVKG